MFAPTGSQQEHERRGYGGNDAEDEGGQRGLDFFERHNDYGRDHGANL